jgi:hypothetical protein
MSFTPVHKLAGKMGLSKLERGIAPLACIYIIWKEIFNWSNNTELRILQHKSKNS